MKRTVLVAGMGPLTLTDRDFVGAGGEADVFRKDTLALKLYHDAARTPTQHKLTELQHIDAADILRPEAMVYDPKSQTPIGYTMPFVQGRSLVQYFPPVFRNQIGMGMQEAGLLVKAMHKLIVRVHQAGCLVVDLNEMNVLIHPNHRRAYFIDTDSYQTPTHPATALCAGIADPQTAHGSFSPMSDWFSFAILAFQLYVGIHPYRGIHPNYKPSAWQQRMVDGVSVFDAKTVLPPGFDNFNTRMPAVHYDWFHALFSENKRLAPPDLCSADLVQQTMRVSIQRDHKDLLITELIRLPQTIRGAFDLVGTLYFVTRDAVYEGNRRVAQVPTHGEIKMMASEQGDPVLVHILTGRVRFLLIDGTLIDETPALGCFVRDGICYTVDGPRLLRHSFTRLGGKWVRKCHQEGKPECSTGNIHDGLIVKQALGRTWVMVPIKPGRCLFTRVSELEGYRIVTAGARRHLALVIGERSGDYTRFVLWMDVHSGRVKVRSETCNFHTPNFAVTPNGVCAHLTPEPRLVLFADHHHLRCFEDPPLEAGVRVFQSSGRICVLADNRVLRVSTLSV